MAVDNQTLGAARKHVAETLVGMGALAGKNCTIRQIDPIEGGNRITFYWTQDDGTVRTSTLEVMNGESGSDGKSIYDIWLELGNTGTEEDFINSLKGETGDNGKSVYDIWLELGNVGTEEEFLESLKGNGVDNTSDYVVNCEVISETDETAEVVNYDGNFAKIKQTIVDGRRVELRAIFNSTLYNLEVSRIEDDRVSFNTVDRYSNITIEVNENGISDVSYISLRFEPGGEVVDSVFIVSGNINMDNETASFNQTFEEIKTAQFDGKALQAEMLVTSGEDEAVKYGFNLLFSTGEAIGFDWINSTAKLGMQVTLFEDDTTTLSMTSLEGGGSGESYDDTELRERIEDKQDATIFIDATMSTVKDSWDNYLLDVDAEYNFANVQQMLLNGKTVVLRVKVDNVLVELQCLSYESYTSSTLTFAAPYYNSSTEEKGSYIAFCASTVGWKLGIKVVKEASNTDMSPFIIKSVYTESGSDGFTVDTSTTTPALWADWYPAFEAGRPVYWDLHKNSIDSNTDVIRLYPHSRGVYYEATGTKECQFISIGGYPNYDSRNDSTKYYYIGWFRSGSSPVSNYKFVKRYKIGEIPTGGTIGQMLVKNSDVDGDVKWVDVTSGEAGCLVITGNYSIDDNDNWTVSNIDKTFAEIDEATTNNQDAVLKIYPEGDTDNPYILYQSMHYKNMGSAFSLMVSDEGQISGLSVMITADNQVMASRNEYDFSKLLTEIDHVKESASVCELTLGYTCTNLIPSPYGTSPVESRGITFTPNADGTVNYSGIANDPTAAFYTFPTVLYLPAGSYKVTGGDDIYGGAGVLLYDDKECTITYTGGHEGLLTISTTSVYVYNTLDGTVNWSTSNTYGYEKEFTIDKPAYAKVQARSVNNTHTEEVSGLIYPMIRPASVEDDTWEPYKPNVDERLKNLLGGKEVKAINNQFGSTTKLFRITGAPTESGKAYTVKLVAQRKNATVHSESLSVSRVGDAYTYDCAVEMQERNGSTGEATTMENSNFLIVDANHEVWAHIPSYTYAYVELISPNAKGTFVIDGTEGEFAEDAVFDTFSKRETDTFAKKGDLEELKKSVSDGKTAVAGAITAKGIDTAADDELATMAENIGKIEAPIIDLKFVEGSKEMYIPTITEGSNTFVAWMNKSMYYSEDGGATWKVSSLKDTTYGNSPTVIYAKEYDVFAVLIPATDHGVYVSQDGGKNWTLKMGYSNVDSLQYSNGIFVGCSCGTTSGGITYSPDGDYWSLNSNFSSKSITSLRCVNGRWFFVASGTTYTSTDGYNWTGLTGVAAGSSFSSILYYQGLWIANGSNSTILYSTDGVTWNSCTFNWSNTQYGTSIQALRRIKNTYVVSTYNGMYYSTDRGKTWNPSNITTGNHKFQLFAGKILALGQGGPTAGKGVYTSNNGQSWTQATSFPNTGSTNGKVFLRNGKIFVTGADSSLYSSSDGATWTKIDGACTLNAEFNGVLIAEQFKYSLDGVNWKSIKPADVTFTSCQYYKLGCNSVLACNSTNGIFYSKAYFS